MADAGSVNGQRAPEVLILAGRRGSVVALDRALRDAGVRVDVVHDLGELRLAFFQAGGHDVLLVAHDIPTAVVDRAVAGVVELDPGVRVITFGPPIGRHPSGRVKRVGLHPASPAAAIAILRAIRA